MENGYEIKNEMRAFDFWKSLPGTGGEYFSLHDDCIAGAQANRLTVWCGEDKVFEGYSPLACDGYPRWKADSVFWNNNRINFREGRQFPLENLKETVYGIADRDPDPAKTMMQRAVAFDWSPDAENFLFTAELNSDTAGRRARAVLSDKNGKDEKLLWEGNDFAPGSACIGKKWIVLGTRNIMIFDRGGKLIETLPGELLPKRIHMAEDESVLFVQTYESIRIWHTGSWLLKSVIKGPWLNAALSPGAGTVYAIDFEGNLYAAGLPDERSSLRKIPVPDPLTTIDAGEEWLVAGFAKGDAVRRASRKVLDLFLTGSAE